MLPFGVTIPATVPQGSEIPEGLMNNSVYRISRKPPPVKIMRDQKTTGECGMF